jgi:RNA polymerase sigma factor (sigma-70 family)
MPAAKGEHKFREVSVDKLILESFKNEQSAYFIPGSDEPPERLVDKFRRKLQWHITHTLSPRQREVIQFYLKGKKEREIAGILGVTQQVVNIYKHRAIKKLHRALTA